MSRHRPATHEAVAQDIVLSVTSLALTHFRNYESARLEISDRPVVLFGPNGAGKTNILEAVSLLAPGRGLRRAQLNEMDRLGMCWTVAATATGLSGEVKIGVGRDPESAAGSDKRLLRIDGKPAKSQAQLAQHLSIFWLTPQMERLFDQSASEGRRFLDRMVYGFDPEHAARVSKYETAMRERNRLLEQGGADGAWLDALEQTMAETGAAVAEARLSAVDRLNHAISLSKRSFPKAHLAVAGFMEDLLRQGVTAIETEEKCRRMFCESRRRDAAAGRALAGPHRSEMRVMHVEKNMPAEACSTGEQKALMLSMTLAQIRASMLWRQVVPILLLDDVSAHLDAARRLELFEEICQTQAQVWMTGTDRSFFAPLGSGAQFFELENGGIIHE